MTRRILGLLIIVVLASLLACQGPATETGSATDQGAAASKARSEPLLTQELAPSAAEQTIAIGQQLSLTLPGGALAEAATLSVSQISRGAPAPPTSREALAVYEIGLGGQAEFDQALTLELAYDPDDLDPDAPADAQLTVAYYDEERGAWVTVPALVDEARHRLVVHTDHLSVWAYFRWMRGYETLYCGDHFVLAYDKEAVTTGSSASYAGPYAQPALALRPAIISDVCNFLNTSYAAYKQAGFAMPEGRIKVVIGEFADPYTEAFTGVIHITLESWYDVNLLRQQAAHELFHVVQMHQLGTRTMDRRLWWMEATAEYASSEVAWAAIGGTGTMGGDIRPKYLELPIVSREDYHDYATAHFLAFLHTQIPTMTFKELWDAAAGGDNTLELLDPVVTAKSGAPLGLWYVRFAQHYVFDAISPMPSVASLSGEVADKLSRFLVEKTEETHTLSVDYYASKIWAIENQKERDVTVERLGGEGGWVFATVVRGDDKLSPIVAGPLAVEVGKPISLHLASGDRLFIQATNASGRSGIAFNLRVAETAIPSGMYTMYLKFDDGCDAHFSGGYNSWARLNRFPVKIEGNQATVDYDKFTNGKHLVATGSGSIDAQGRLTLDMVVVFTREPCDEGPCPCGPDGCIYREHLTAQFVGEWVPNRNLWQGALTGSVQVDRKDEFGFSCNAAPISATVEPGFVDTPL